VIVGLYFVLPLDDNRDLATTLALTAGLIGFAVVVAFQAWQITRSDLPGLRAVEALATSLPLFLVLFAGTYVLLGDDDASAFSEALTRTDALYFTVTIFSTVGFGDITPRSQAARIVVMVQMFGGLVYLGLVVRLLFGAVEVAKRRQSESPSDASSDPPGGSGE
jgi:hypothetical protein